MTTDIDTQSVTVATQLIGLDAKWLQPFDVEDPFNDNLRLRGFLCQKPDYRYGALVITHVGERKYRTILATPSYITRLAKTVVYFHRLKGSSVRKVGSLRVRVLSGH
jgi:hypothetical protein